MIFELIPNLDVFPCYNICPFQTDCWFFFILSINVQRLGHHCRRYHFSGYYSISLLCDSVIWIPPSAMNGHLCFHHSDASLIAADMMSGVHRIKLIVIVIDKKGLLTNVLHVLVVVYFVEITMFDRYSLSCIGKKHCCIYVND